MPFAMTWYIPKRVIYLKIEGDITIADIEAISTHLIEMLDQGTAPVHCFADDENIGKIPYKIAEFRKTATALAHPSMGWLIAIGLVHPMVNFIIPLIAQLFKVNYYRCYTVKQAQDILTRRDTSINWDEATTNSS